MDEMKKEKTFDSIDKDVPALILDEGGIIRDCSKAAEKLFGCAKDKLLWLHASLLIPQFCNGLIDGGKLNPMVNFLCHCGHLFAVQDMQGHAFLSELHITELVSAEGPVWRMIFSPS